MVDDSKRFYWLKLDEKFFEEDTMQFIEEQKNGEKYLLFYLKLCLHSLKNNGVLVRHVGEKMIPFNVDSLAKLTKTDNDSVRVAIELFSDLGIVKKLDSGELQMSMINEMLGSETLAAQRKRVQRVKKKNSVKSIESGTLSQGCPGDVPQSIEYRVKSIDYNSCNSPKKSDAPKQPKKVNYTDEFNQFWECYPKSRRVGKAKAFLSWKKMKPPIEKCLETLAIFKASKQWTDKGGQFIPHPTTWLNRGGWEDETEDTVDMSNPWKGEMNFEL